MADGLQANIEGNLALLRGKPWERCEAPPEAQNFPSMLSKQERNLLNWLAKDYWTGAGEIVDAGCFLGGSTVSFATGLRDRGAPTPARRSLWSRLTGAKPAVPAAAPPPANPRLHAFDMFIIDHQFMLDYWGKVLEGVPLNGGSRKVFDQLTADYRPYFNVNHGDITKIGWTGKPIEVLFLDVLKTSEVNDAVLRDFLPSIIPGRTVLIQQDYVHEWLPWIHVTMEILHDHFEYLDWMPYATTVYLHTKPIPASTIAACRWDAIPNAEKLRLMDRAIARFDGLPRGLIDCAKGVLLEEIKGVDAALLHWRQCGRTYAGLRQVTTAAEKLAEHYAQLQRRAA